MAADLRRGEYVIAKLQENKEISPLKPQYASECSCRRIFSCKYAYDYAETMMLCSAAARPIVANSAMRIKG